MQFNTRVCVSSLCDICLFHDSQFMIRHNVISEWKNVLIPLRVLCSRASALAIQILDTFTGWPRSGNHSADLLLGNTARGLRAIYFRKLAALRSGAQQRRSRAGLSVGQESHFVRH